MRILCRHGHYAFYPEGPRELGRLAENFSLDFLPERDYFTFAKLAGLETYSIKGKPYGNFLPATKTYQGLPWEVMRENGFVWSLALKTLVPKSTIVTVAKPSPLAWAWQSQTMFFQAGSLVSGERIVSFDGNLDDIRQIFTIRSMASE